MQMHPNQFIAILRCLFLNSIVMLNKLIRGDAGFARGIRVAAFLVLGCLLLGNILMRRPESLRDTAEEGDAELAEAPNATVEKAREPLWDRHFFLILLAAFLVSLGSYFPIYYVQQFANLHGVDKSLSFYSVAILNAANIFGRIIPNFIADKVGTWVTFTTLVLLNGNVRGNVHYCIFAYSLYRTHYLRHVGVWEPSRPGCFLNIVSLRN